MFTREKHKLHFRYIGYGQRDKILSLLLCPAKSCLGTSVNIHILLNYWVVLQCLPPPFLPNGNHSGQHLTSFPLEIYVYYTCDYGYLLHGIATSHCMALGTWSQLLSHVKVFSIFLLQLLYTVNVNGRIRSWNSVLFLSSDALSCTPKD